MMNNQLIKISAQFYQYVRHTGCVEILLERYADPRKPNLCKLWVVNGVHEFKKQWDSRCFMSKLADRVGGDQKLTNETYRAAYDNIIPTYTEETRAAAILG